MPVSIPVPIEPASSFDLRLEYRAQRCDSGIEASGRMLMQLDVEGVSLGDEGEQFRRR